MQPTTFSNSPLRILVADDDPILCAMAQHTLAELGEISVAEHGAAAWERLQREAFDLVLLDLEMPLLDGFDVLKRVRMQDALADLPVVVLTGRKDHWAIEEAFDRGATSFITKPVNWPLLRHQVRYVLRAADTERRLEVVRSAVA